MNVIELSRSIKNAEESVVKIISSELSIPEETVSKIISMYRNMIRDTMNSILGERNADRSEDKE